MVTNYPSLRFIAILSCLYPSYSHAATVENDASPIISPFDVAKSNDSTSSTSVSPFDVVDNTLSQDTLTDGASTYQPTLVGVVVNGQEQGNYDALYDTRINIQAVANRNDHYYLSIKNIRQLTAVTIVKSSPIEGINNSYLYQVKTPIGDVNLTTEQIMSYSGSQLTLSADTNTDYISLSTLKALGISAEYHPQDLAIKLNMGWQPESIRSASQSNGSNGSNESSTKPSIDYYPTKAGLIGLSFNSALSLNEGTRSIYNGLEDSNYTNDNNVSHQTTANIGAFGYAAGGIWGVSGVGNDSGTNKDRQQQEESGFIDYGIDSLTTLPWDWQNWQIDNLYWVRSWEHYATRIGTSRPNALGRGTHIGGSEFTGAMVAYSNRNITRHLATFDDNSDSLLENTNQDYQNLSGIAEPGGVAELRINSRPIARVQIGLNGRYEFLNLDVNGLDLTDTFVEIAIYEYPTASQPLEVRPMFLGKRRTNTATGEVLVEAGLGRSGNLLDNDNSYDDSQFAAHVYVEYGVNNRLAVRGGVNKIPTKDNDKDIAWHAGLNFAPTSSSNADLNYAHSPTQDVWQMDLSYEHKKLWLDYQYQARQYQAKQYQARPYPNPQQTLDNSLTTDTDLFDQRHQLLLNYRPSDKTTININQYYNDLDNKFGSRSNGDDYYVYASVNRRFNKSLNGGINWDSRDNRYGYRILWQDIPNLLTYDLKGDAIQNRRYQRTSLGLSGDNNSETLSVRHVLNNRISLGQSVSHLHGASHLLYQGDMSYRFDNDRVDGLNNADSDSQLSNQVNVGYSLYDNNFGWQADWQLTHQNGLSFGLGYQHRYVNSIPNQSINKTFGGTIVGSTVDNNLLNRRWSDTPWGSENYLYARLSFDMFKTTKQPLRIGRVSSQRSGSIVINIAHPPEPVIEAQSMSFSLNGQKVEASLLSAQTTQSQYLISNIRAGEYTLKMDAKNLPIEFSTTELLSTYIKVSNYAPTYVPIELQKTFGISGKLDDDKQGIAINVYQDNTLIQTLTSGSYGYFQAFGLPSGKYVIRAEGYEPQVVNIDNDFVLQVALMPNMM